MNEKRLSCEDIKIKGSSTSVETESSNLSCDFTQPSTCKKAACSIHKLFAEWFNSKLEQKKKDSEGKEAADSKLKKEWPDYKAYLFKR